MFFNVQLTFSVNKFNIVWFQKSLCLISSYSVIQLFKRINYIFVQRRLIFCNGMLVLEAFTIVHIP